MRKFRTRKDRLRRGNIAPLVAIILPAIGVLIAYMLEISRVHMTKSQLQAIADAGAFSGAQLLRHTDSSLESTSFTLNGVGLEAAMQSSSDIVAANSIAGLGPGMPNQLVAQINQANMPDGDIVLGNATLMGEFTPTLGAVNAVKVVARLQASHPNGRLNLFFGRLLGTASVDLQADAIARVEKPTLVPFLIYLPQWTALKQRNGTDLFSVDTTNGTVSLGADGVLETTVFPNDWDGLNMPPGNFGWYDFGLSNGTTDLCRQLDQGPNEMEMAYFGGSLDAGEYVSGVTGIKAGTEAAFVGGTFDGVTYSGILGKPRVIALYDIASGQGTNATFRIVKFVLARIVAADLSGSPKQVVVQPITKHDDPHKIQLVE